MQRSKLLLIILITLLLSACSSEGVKNNEVEITISVAASMTDAMKEVISAFEKENETIEVFLNVGSSGALQQQIIQGAPVDLYLSAAEDKFNYVLERELIIENKSTRLLKNDLVLIQPINTEVNLVNFKDLLRSEVGRIAIGTPESVPAGSYAKETLKSLEIFQEVKEKLIFAKDVRQVLQYVETGNVQAGIVYKTDAMQSDEVKIVATVRDENHTPIVYPVGVMRDSAHIAEATLFYDFIGTNQSIRIFKKYGFKSVSDINVD